MSNEREEHRPHRNHRELERKNHDDRRQQRKRREYERKEHRERKFKTLKSTYREYKTAILLGIACGLWLNMLDNIAAYIHQILQAEKYVYENLYQETERQTEQIGNWKL